MTHCEPERNRRGVNNEGLLLTHRGSGALLSLQQLAQGSVNVVWPVITAEVEVEVRLITVKNVLRTVSNWLQWGTLSYQLHEIKTKAQWNISHFSQALPWWSFIMARQATVTKESFSEKKKSVATCEVKAQSFNGKRLKHLKTDYSAQLTGHIQQITPNVTSW